jgi:hypothetical protein
VYIAPAPTAEVTAEGTMFRDECVMSDPRAEAPIIAESVAIDPKDKSAPVTIEINQEVPAQRAEDISARLTDCGSMFILLGWKIKIPINH